MQLSTESKISYLKLVTGKDYELTGVVEEKYLNDEKVNKPYAYGCNENQIVWGHVETADVHGTSAMAIHIGFHSSEGNDGNFISDNSVELGNGIVFDGLFQKVEGNSVEGVVIVAGELFTQI